MGIGDIFNDSFFFFNSVVVGVLRLQTGKKLGDKELQAAECQLRFEKEPWKRKERPTKKKTVCFPHIRCELGEECGRKRLMAQDRGDNSEVTGESENVRTSGEKHPT